MTIILASSSAWRAKLLTGWGFKFETRPSNVDEEAEKNTIPDPRLLVEALALKKYQACLRKNEAEIILAADTVIFCQHQIIGKPTDRRHAAQIIRFLQGKTHQVWTGFCLNGQLFSDVASVALKPMTNTQINTYLETRDWVGKAGAYQIQKSIRPYITKIDGDINTVIGLPTTVRSKLLFVINTYRRNQ